MQEKQARVLGFREAESWVRAWSKEESRVANRGISRLFFYILFQIYISRLNLNMPKGMKK